jgi:hypothetical protein
LSALSAPKIFGVSVSLVLILVWYEMVWFEMVWYEMV